MGIIKNKTDETIDFSTVDHRTGEPIDSFSIEPGGALKTETVSALKQKYKDQHIMQFNKEARFGKLYIDMMEYIEQELTPADWMFFSRLLKFVNFETCILCKDNNVRTPLLNVHNIAEVLKKDDKVCYKHMKSLIDKELIIVLYTGHKDHRKGGYACNPYIFFVGQNLNKELAPWELFMTTRWAEFNYKICHPESNNIS